MMIIAVASYKNGNPLEVVLSTLEEFICKSRCCSLANAQATCDCPIGSLVIIGYGRALNNEHGERVGISPDCGKAVRSDESKRWDL